MILNNISEFIDILNNSTELTLLVGAGCSIESPSNLPGGSQMMEEIIKYSCCVVRSKNSFFIPLDIISAVLKITLFISIILYPFFLFQEQFNGAILHSTI